MQYLTNSKMPDYVPDKKDGSGTGVCEGEHKHPMAGEAGVRRKTPLTVHVRLEAGKRMKGGKGHSQAYKVGFKHPFKNKKGRWHTRSLGG